MAYNKIFCIKKGISDESYCEHCRANAITNHSDFKCYKWTKKKNLAK